MANYLEEIEQLSLSVEDLVDAEPPIIINTLTRNLEIQSGFNTQIAVEGDLSANEVTFECDRYIEGYEVYGTDSAYVIWRNEEAGTEDAYLVTNRVLDSEEKSFKFSWLLTREVAELAGKLECSVCFIDYADPERTIISYKWASNPLKELSVGLGVPNVEIDEKDFVVIEDIPRDPAEAVARLLLKDQESEILFNMFNRNFTFDPEMNMQIAVAGDCFSNMVTFKVDKKTCDYNIEEASIALVKWRINDTSNYDVLERVSLDENYGVYTWIVPPALAQLEGELTFCICFITVDKDHMVISRWNSNPCSVLYVGKGLYLAEIDDMEKLDKPLEGEVPQAELNKILQEVFGI